MAKERFADRGSRSQSAKVILFPEHHRCTQRGCVTDLYAPYAAGREGFESTSSGVEFHARKLNAWQAAAAHGSLTSSWGYRSRAWHRYCTASSSSLWSLLVKHRKLMPLLEGDDRASRGSTLTAVVAPRRIGSSYVGELTCNAAQGSVCQECRAVCAPTGMTGTLVVLDAAYRVEAAGSY